MDILPTDGVGAPVRWFLVFHRRADLWWVNLIPGRFKHVRAFAYVAETDTWVFHDVGFGRIGVSLARGAGANARMAEWCDGATLLSIAPRITERLTFFPFCCTTVIANLIGLPTHALRPDGLYRACLRAGAAGHSS